MALVEAGWLVDATLGRLAPLDALAIVRGELYAALVSSPHWRWAQGRTSENAMRDGGEAVDRIRRRPSIATEFPPTRAGLDALLIAIAHQIQEEVPRGEGTDADVERFTRLWRYALTPFLWPYGAREHPGADLRGPFDELVQDLVELAFRELGHARISAPPFGGRSLAEWVKDLKRRREAVVAALVGQALGGARQAAPSTGGHREALSSLGPP